MKNTSSKMKQNRKIVMIIAIVLAIALLTFVAYRLFFTQKDLVKFTGNLPEGTTLGKMYVDQVSLSTEKKGRYQLSGWGFLTAQTNLTPDDFERTVLLTSGADAFTLKAETVQRVDVQKAFVDLNMVLVNSGFSTEFSLNKLPVGKYSISLIFKASDGSETLLSSIWVLDRTADSVLLTRNK